MSGIRIYAHDTFPGTNHGLDWHEEVLESWDETPAEYIARPVPEDEAREAVIAATRAYVRLIAAAPEMREAPDFESAYEDLLTALDRLDALDATP